MATASCTINGFKYYNGGWIPSSGFSTANSSVSGYGGGSSYAAVYKFTIPSVSGTVSSATITFNLPWIDGGYYNNFNSNWYITTGAPSSGMAVQGTQKASGNVQGAGSGSQQWKTVTFTTGAFSASAGTYYLWLTGGSMSAEFGGHLTATLNYTTGGSSGSTSSTTIRPTASLDRDVKNGTSWANYTQDSDCSAYDSGYTIRIGGSTSAKNFNGWFTFPTGSSFLDPAKYEITAANFKVFQPYFASPNAYSGSGTIRFRAGKMTPSGTNGLSSTSQTATVAAITTDGTWYTFSNTLAAAKALQSGAANGVYMDVSDWSSKYWYSRLTYHGGSSYYPRFTVSYKSKQYALSVPAVTGASVNGAGTFTWGTSVTVTCTPNTGYTFSKWQLSGGSSASSTSSTYKFTMPTAATTARAVVTKNTYTLTVAKPTGVSAVSGGGSKTWGTSVTVSCTPATGYKFVRWQLSGGSTATSTSQSYTFTMPMAATTATPVVEKIPYTLTYNANGGSVSPSSSTFYYGDIITGMPTPTRSNYSFDYWYVSFNGSNYLNLGRQYMYTDKLSVHIEAYMDNWANYDSSSMRLISCTESGGWNIESSSSYVNFACYDSGYGYKNAKTSVTWASLSAGWHSFDLVFDGSKVHGYIDGVEKATSEAYQSKKIGYTNTSNSIFVGAEAGGNGSTPVGQYFTGKIRNLVISNSNTRITNANGKFVSPMQNFTMEASWTKDNYNVYLDGNGGTVPWDVKSVGVGDVIVLPTSAQCSRDNYELLGFSISSTATTATYAAGSTYTPTGSTTLYAIWRASGTLRLGSETYTPYVYYNGAWVTATPYAYVNGKWVEGI